MRILHVMDHSLPKTSGYTIRAKYLLEAQVKGGHEVTVLTSPSQGAGATDLEANGVHYRRVDYTAAEGRWVARGAKHAVFGRAIARGMAALFAAGRFDIVHAHTPFTVARVGLDGARRRKLPFVYEKRNLWEESARARGKASGRWPWFQVAQAFDRAVTVRADAVCTITQALKAHTVSMGVPEERVFVVGNGVDVEAFTPRVAPPALRARCAGRGNFVIGFVGSFFSYEGLPLLLEAFAAVLPRYPTVRLVLVGDGEDRARLERDVARLGLGESVWLTGQVPHSEVADFYACMDVLVYPRYPSMLTHMISPLKPLEPMAMGRCVIGSDAGGIRELIQDKTSGLLFRAGDCAALEAQLDALLSGRIDAAALGQSARAVVTERRQWAHMAAVYDAAYACAQRRRSPQAAA